jgi:hypothetical protein
MKEVIEMKNSHSRRNHKKETFIFTVLDVRWQRIGGSKALVIQGLLDNQHGVKRIFEDPRFILKNGSTEMIDEYVKGFCTAFHIKYKGFSNYSAIVGKKAKVHCYRNKNGYETLTKPKWITSSKRK